MLKKDVYVKVLPNVLENRSLYNKIESTGKLIEYSRLKNMPHEEFLETVKKFKKEAIDLLVKGKISDKDFYILTTTSHKAKDGTINAGLLNNINDAYSNTVEYKIKLLSLDKDSSEDYKFIVDNIEITNYGLIYVNILNNISISNTINKSLVMVNGDETIYYSTPIENIHMEKSNIDILKITVEPTQEYMPLIPF